MAKEDIRGGGFQGGVFIQAPQPQKSPLFDLADALGTLNAQGGQAVLSSVRERTDRINEETRLNDIQREKDGTASAESFIAKNIGLDSAALEAAMANPDVAEIMENPWAAAAVQKHRGRKRGDELAAQMVEAGVDTSDQEAVAQFYADNAPEGEVNQFFASGLNEQNQRFLAQWTQEGIAKNAREIAIEKTSAWGAEANQMIADGVPLAGVMAEIKNFAGIKGSEATGIQLEILEAKANEGDIAFVEEWANLPRDGAPSLADDGNHQATVQSLIKRAAQIHQANGAEARYQTTIKIDEWMFQAPFAQLTRKNLENTPGFEALEGDQQRQLYRQLESERDSRISASADGANAAYVRAEKNTAIAGAVRLMQQQRGAEIVDAVIVDQKGAVTTLSAEYLRGLAVEQQRTKVLGDSPFTQSPAQIANYAMNMRANDVIDPAFQRYLSAAASALTPQGVAKGFEKGIMQRAEAFALMDPEVAKEYVPDPQARAVFEHIAEMARDTAGADVDEAAVVNLAVAKAYGPPPILKIDNVDVAKTLKGVKLKPPGGGKVINPYSVNPGETRNLFYERYSEASRLGFPDAVARERALAAIQSEMVVVNGMPVRMPTRAGLVATDPTKPLMTGEEFSLVADYAVKAKAQELGIDPEDLLIRRNSGNLYEFRSVDGQIFSATVQQMQLWASAYSQFAGAEAKRLQAEKDAEAVAKAVSKREKNDARVVAAEKMHNDNVMGP